MTQEITHKQIYEKDVGYKIEQETFDDQISSISATNIRKQLGIQ